MKHLIFLLTIVAVFISARAGAAEPPMTKIVTRAIGPAIKSGSFAAKPKTIYLAGKKYARIEEESDIENKIHELVVINEPDTWLINLADNTARHAVDPGPTFNVHSPVFWTAKPEGEPDPAKEFKDLEFGSELQFFRQHAAQDIGMRQVEGKNCKALQLKTDSREVTLLLDPSSGKPYQVDIAKNGKLEGSIRYLEYKTDLPFQKSLFQPPKGVRTESTNTSKAGSVSTIGRYKELADWAERDNQNSRQFANELRKAQNARDVAAALRASARRQRKTTDDLIKLVRSYAELRNCPQLGLDDEGIKLWEQSHPDAKVRRANIPPEVIAVSEQMRRFNEALEANEGGQTSQILGKYRGQPEVMPAAEELGRVLRENRRKLLEAFR